MTESKTLVKGLMGDNFIMVNRTIAKFTGFSEAGIIAEMLSVYDACDKQISGKTANGERYNFNFFKEGKEGEWFYLTKETMEEKTGMKRPEYDTGVKNLIKNGLIQKKVMGLPSKMYFNVNWERIADIMTGKAEKTAPLSESVNPASLDDGIQLPSSTESSNLDSVIPATTIFKELELITIPKQNIDDDDNAQARESEIIPIPLKPKERNSIYNNWLLAFKEHIGEIELTRLTAKQRQTFNDFIDVDGCEEELLCWTLEESKFKDSPLYYSVSLLNKFVDKGIKTAGQAQAQKKYPKEEQELKRASGGTTYTGGNHRQPDFIQQVATGQASVTLDAFRPRTEVGEI